MAIAFVNLGSVGIAVLFSILPALRAAFLHPVRALRFE
jgi:ABC-type antimicrobial peptide transport system permease subunit